MATSSLTPTQCDERFVHVIFLKSLMTESVCSSDFLVFLVGDM